MHSRWLWCLCLLMGLNYAGGARPMPVAVRRCCPSGSRLADLALQQRIIQRAAAHDACELLPQDASNSTWKLRIYAPSLGKMLERAPPHWSFTPGILPDCDSIRVLFEHVAPYALLANNASLVESGAVRGLPPNRYCVDARAALACGEDAPPPVAAKCCAESASWDGSAGCTWDEASASAGAAAVAQLRELGAPGVKVGWPSCPAGPLFAEAGLLSSATWSSDGSLELAGGVLEHGAWCADGVAGKVGARVLACESDAHATPDALHAVYGVGLAVGSLFLLATLMAGFTLPPSHRALHWRCQTHYVAALFLGDVLLAATQLAGADVPPGLCRALAVCMHFLFLAAFFWLNTMCFNIWWTFRDFRPTSAERSQEACRLRVYQVYAWGAPLLLASVAAALDGGGGGDQALAPRFAQRRCWFYGDAEALAYFFGPVGALLLVNAALFASTARQLACGLWRRDEVKASGAGERAALGRVCAKLVVVMGVTWGADVVSWAAGGPRLLWAATDLLNALQGALIFAVVGWHAHAKAALRRLFARLPAAQANQTARSCGESLTHTTPAPPPSGPPSLPSTLPPKETPC